MRRRDIAMAHNVVELVAASGVYSRVLERLEMRCSGCGVELTVQPHLHNTVRFARKFCDRPFICKTHGSSAYECFFECMCTVCPRRDLQTYSHCNSDTAGDVS